ncbi:MAG TPA: translation elongation factor Ts [Candidatus Babeliales bacterium]|nr:translation elongation factor Ts [Candidatus Babeliales bacterium]
MAKIDLKLVQELRTRTGLGMLDCRKALEEANGSMEEAVELLRKRGAAVAAKRVGKDTQEGLVHAYIHPGSQVGVLVEINCETDFVARTEELRNFAQDLCLQITAFKPLYLKPEDVSPEFIAHETEVFKAQLAGANKPENVINSIIKGKLDKLFSEICLVKQAYLRDDQKTIEDCVQDLMARTGENITIRRFARYQVGA